MKTKILLLTLIATAVTGCSTLKSSSDDLQERVDSSIAHLVQKTQAKTLERENAEKGIVTIAPRQSSPIDQTIATRKTKAPVGEKVALGKSDKIEAQKVELKAPVATVETKVSNIDTSKMEKVTSSSLDQTVNMRWKGDANQVLKTLSNRLGYDYSVSGKSTSLPISLVAKNEPVSAVLSNIASQTKDKADIKLSPASKTIQLIYK